MRISANTVVQLVESEPPQLVVVNDDTGAEHAMELWGIPPLDVKLILESPPDPATYDGVVLTEEELNSYNYAVGYFSAQVRVNGLMFPVKEGLHEEALTQDELPQPE
jgi:hypothetical protein